MSCCKVNVGLSSDGAFWAVDQGSDEQPRVWEWFHIIPWYSSIRRTGNWGLCWKNSHVDPKHKMTMANYIKKCGLFHHSSSRPAVTRIQSSFFTTWGSIQLWLIRLLSRPWLWNWVGVLLAIFACAILLLYDSLTLLLFYYSFTLRCRSYVGKVSSKLPLTF